MDDQDDVTTSGSIGSQGRVRRAIGDESTESDSSLPKRARVLPQTNLSRVQQLPRGLRLRRQFSEPSVPSTPSYPGSGLPHNSSETNFCESDIFGPSVHQSNDMLYPDDRSMSDTAGPSGVQGGEWRANEMVDVSFSDDSLPSANESSFAYWMKPKYDRDQIPSILVSGIGSDESRGESWTSSSRPKKTRGFLSRSVSDESDSLTEPKSSIIHPEYALELFSILTEMKEGLDMVDITVITDNDQRIQCHRGMLVAGSPLIRQKVTKNPDENELIINDVRSDIVQDIIHFIYTHRIGIGSHNSHELMQICLNKEPFLGKAVELACSEYLVGQFCLDTGSETSSLSAISSSIFSPEDDIKGSDKDGGLPDCSFKEQNYPLEVLNELNEDRKQGLFTDIILKVDDSVFHCHKFILVAVSQYFRAMLTYDMIEQSANEICLKDIKVEYFTFLMDFIYTCKLTINVDNAQELMETACFLQIKPAIQACSKFLKEKLEIDNCWDILNFARVYDVAELYDDAFDYALIKFTDVIHTDAFLELDANVMSSYFACDRLNAKHEETVYEAFYKWLQVDQSARLPIAAVVLRNIRLPLVDPMYFTTVIEGDENISQREDCRKVLDEALQLREQSGKGDQVNDVRLKLRFSMTKQVMVVVGGYDDQQRWVRNVWCYCPPDDSWTSLAPFPGRNQRFATVALNNNVYVIGGQDDNGRMSETLADVWRYDSITNTWSQVASMTKPRHGHTATVIGKKIYVIGGKSGWAKKFNDIECYDSKLNIWVNLTRIKGSYLEKPVASVVEGKLYINGYFYRDPDIMHCYDPRENEWKQIYSFQRLPGDALENSVVVNDVIFFLVYRGYDNFAVSFNPLTNELFRGTVLPDGKYLYSYGATVIGDKIYIAGGSKLDASINVPFVFCYDPALDVWGMVGTMPHPLCEHGCVTIEKYMP